MKPSALFEALHALIGQRVPLHIWGACGVGKSQIVAQVASGLNWQSLDVRAVQLDPVDLRGLPRIAADQAEWVPPKFLPTSGQGILFLDELTSAPQMTQAGCYQLVLDRKLGEYRLPDGWMVIAAGNPASERGVYFSMPRPLRNRFVHLDLEPDFEDWSKWAVKANIRPEIIAFLRFKPTLLHDADATSDVNAWPTPRSWEMASSVHCARPRAHGSLARQGDALSRPHADRASCLGHARCSWMLTGGNCCAAPVGDHSG
jgi:AAA domain (dynein-related subfamily)